MVMTSWLIANQQKELPLKNIQLMLAAIINSTKHGTSHDNKLHYEAFWPVFWGRLNILN